MERVKGKNKYYFREPEPFTFFPVCRRPHFNSKHEQGRRVKGAKHERSELALEAPAAHVKKIEATKKLSWKFFKYKVEMDAWLMHNNFRQTIFEGNHASVHILWNYETK